MSKSLEKRDIPVYIANLLRIADSSGNIDGEESFALQSVFERVGADQDDLAAARDMLNQGRGRLYLPSSTNARMDNLQDMIMVALADGKITPLESEPIEKFARALKYSQADIDLALRRAKSALHKISQRHSSQQLREERKSQRVRSWRSDVAKPPPLPPQKVEIPMAPKPPPVPPVLEDDLPQEATPPPAVEPEPAVAAGESTQIPASPSNVPELTECMRCREQSDNPACYCFGVPDGPFNPWGCRFSRLFWQEGEAWLKMGHFRDSASFVFDKKAIAQMLTENLGVALDCPYLNTEYTEAAFDCLPARVRMGLRWDYNVAPVASQSASLLTTAEYLHGCRVNKRISADGVIPLGVRDALKIVRRAIRKTDGDYNLYLQLKDKTTA
jgi:hypothetical protein